MAALRSLGEVRTARCVLPALLQVAWPPYSSRPPPRYLSPAAGLALLGAAAAHCLLLPPPPSLWAPLQSLQLLVF